MKLNFSCIFIFVCSYNLLFAQVKIQGNVIDELNNNIYNANVFITSLNSEATYETITDKDGSFSLDIAPGNYEIEINFEFSYWNDLLDIESDTILNDIQLISENSILLEGAVISTSGKVVQRKGNKLVYNIDKSPLSTQTNLTDILNFLPAIEIDQSGNILSRERNVSVKVNGRLLNLSGQNLSDYLKSISGKQITSIEIEKNANSSTDAGNSGVVLNIITKQKNDGFTSNLYTTFKNKYGNHLEHQTNYSFNYGNENLVIYGIYGLNQADDFSRNNSSLIYKISGRNVENTETGESDNLSNLLSIGSILNLNESNELGIELYGNWKKDDYLNHNYFEIFENDQLFDFGENDISGNERNNTMSGILSYKLKLDSLGSNLNFYANYLNQDYSDKFAGTSVYENENFTTLSERNYSKALTDIFSLQADLSKSFNSFDLNSGLKWLNTIRNNSLESYYLENENWQPNERTSEYKYSESIYAAYISANKSWNEKHELEFGVRLEYTDISRKDLIDNSEIENDYANLFPSLSYSYNFTSSNSINFSYNRKIKRPSFGDLNTNIRKVNDFRYEIGNPDLEPEYYDNFDLGYSFKNHHFNLYFINTSNAINGIYFNDNEVAYYQKRNEGNQHQFGLEYFFNNKIFKWWQLNFSSEIYHRKFISNADLDLFEKTTFSLRVNNNFKLSKYNFNLLFRYRSPTADAYYIGKEIIYFDAYIERNFFKDLLSVRLSFEDIFNTLKYTNERDSPDFFTTADLKPRTQIIGLRIGLNISNDMKIKKKKLDEIDNNSDRIN